jgi:hypothetical protein
VRAEQARDVLQMCAGSAHVCRGDAVGNGVMVRAAVAAFARERMFSA